MASVTDIVAAIAACVAAVLSGTALVVAGKRDERRWRREAMTDTLVAFLDASFAGAGQRSYDARSRGEDMTEFRTIAIESHSRRIESLTRLRLLAPADVVIAAERLHDADNAVHTAALNEVDVPDLHRWSELRHAQQQARERLLTAARNTLGLNSAQPIAPTARISTVKETFY